jgi:hypothetical protein
MVGRDRRARSLASAIVTLLHLADGETINVRGQPLTLRTRRLEIIPHLSLERGRGDPDSAN